MKRVIWIVTVVACFVGGNVSCGRASKHADDVIRVLDDKVSKTKVEPKIRRGPREQTCSTCKGVGILYDVNNGVYVTCGKCGGDGKVWVQIP